MFSQDYTVFKPEVWSPRFNFFLKQRLQARKFAQDYSDGYIPGTNKVHVPHIGDNFSASSISTTNGEVSATGVSDTRTILTLDKWEGAAYAMTKYEATVTMSSPKLQDAYAQSMSYALAKKVDTDLLGNIKNLDSSVGTTTSTLLSTQIEQAISIQESNSASIYDSVFLFNPKTYWLDIAAIQKYYDASQMGRPGIVAKGYDASLYGVPVLISENTPQSSNETNTWSHNALVHKSAIIYALRDVQIENKVGEHLRVKPTADVIYGHKLMNSGRGVQLYSSRS